MSEQWPAFVARKNPGSGWGIDILWPDGETEVIKGFITEYDAISGLLNMKTLRVWQENTNDKLNALRQRGA